MGHLRHENHKMTKPVCKECKAIVELRGTFLPARQNSDQETRDARLTLHKVMGGTEEAVKRAEALLGHPVRHLS
jgi:hypothetical protein